MCVNKEQGEFILTMYARYCVLYVRYMGVWSDLNANDKWIETQQNMENERINILAAAVAITTPRHQPKRAREGIRAVTSFLHTHTHTLACYFISFHFIFARSNGISAKGCVLHVCVQMYKLKINVIHTTINWTIAIHQIGNVINFPI